MNDLRTYEIFQRNLSTLKETCVDTHDGIPVPQLTRSERVAINFDKVKEDYIQDLQLAQTPASNDALFETEDGAVVFVEFKNGYLDSKKGYELTKKIYDSMLIFSDITGITIGTSRNMMDYILVYNQEKNKEHQSALERENPATSVQESPSYNRFGDIVSSLGKTETVLFRLKKFENYLFRKVHTYNEEQFERYLSSLTEA